MKHQSPKIIAHRGACYFAPENTLSAFRKAMEMGADGIETDVQVTKDRKLVIHHNYSVDGTTDATGRICDMTLDELKQLDFGAHKGPEFKGERIATLEECLDTVKPLPYVNLELKAPVDRSVPYVEMVVDALQSRDMIAQTVISAFDHTLLRRVKQVCPELRVGALVMAPGMERTPGFRYLAATLPNKPLSEVTKEEVFFPKPLHKFLKADVVGKDPKTILFEILQAFAAMIPEGYTMKDGMEYLKEQDDLVKYVKNLDFPADYLHPDYTAVLKHPNMVKQLGKIGVGVSPFTPDNPEDLAKLYKTDCYGIITNRPDILLDLKKKQ